MRLLPWPFCGVGLTPTTYASTRRYKTMRHRPTECSGTWHRCRIPQWMRVPAPSQIQHLSKQTGTRQALAQIPQYLKRLLDDPLPHRRKEPTPRRHAWSIQHLNKTAGTCRRAPAQMTLCSDQLRLLLDGPMPHRRRDLVPKLHDWSHRQWQQLPRTPTTTCRQRLLLRSRRRAQRLTVTSRAWMLTSTQM